jgi:subtilisin family serine protease
VAKKRFRGERGVHVGRLPAAPKGAEVSKDLALSIGDVDAVLASGKRAGQKQPAATVKAPAFLRADDRKTGDLPVRVLMMVQPTKPVLQVAMGASFAATFERATKKDTPWPAGFTPDAGFRPVAIPVASTEQPTFEMTAVSREPMSDRKIRAPERATMSTAPRSPHSLLEQLDLRARQWHVVRGTVRARDLEAMAQTSKRDGLPMMFADPAVGAFPTCGGTPVGDAQGVRAKLGVGALHANGLDGSRGVAVAVIDTGINLDYLRKHGCNPTLDKHLSWSPQRATLPGQAQVDHGTMCAYDVLLSAPNATLIDLAVLSSTRQSGSVMDGVLSDAVIAYEPLLEMMSLPDEERPYQSLVCTNSWGMFNPNWDFPAGMEGRYADNPNHPFILQMKALSEAGADILFAAGNCGPACPDERCQGIVANTITGANASQWVTTIGGVDLTNAVVGYSSRGPGVIEKQKPDLSCYTHFLGSEVYGRGEPDAGTSAACPVAAGLIAALRSAAPFLTGASKRSPAAMKAFLLKRGSPWNPDTGHGILVGTGLTNVATQLS